MSSKKYLCFNSSKEVRSGFRLSIENFTRVSKYMHTDEDGAIMTNVGPLLLPAEVGCFKFEAAEVVEATTSGKLAGGLGEDDLNLLSSIESNSANCSIVLDDIDLTIVWPIFDVEPFSAGDELDWLDDVVETAD